MIATVNVGMHPIDLAVRHPTGSHVYVAAEDGTVSVIDTTTNTVVNTITIVAGNVLGGVAVSPDGSFAYVTDSTANTLSVINTSTNAVTFTVPLLTPRSRC